MPASTLELYLLIALFWLTISYFKNRSVISIAIEEFNVAPTADSDVLLVIHGHRRGLMAYLINLLGMTTECSLTITKDTICMDSVCISGRTHYLSPLGAISASRSGTSRSVFGLIIGLVFFIGGVSEFSQEHWPAGMVFMVTTGALLAIYILSKRFKMLFYMRSGYPVGLRFTAWQDDDESVELRELQSAMDMVNEAICCAYQPVGPSQT